MQISAHYLLHCYPNYHVSSIRFIVVVSLLPQHD